MKAMKVKKILTGVLIFSLMVSFGWISVSADSSIADGSVAVESMVNINKATADELMILKGIGPKIAEKIIDYRKNNPFVEPEDLMHVKGIGPKIYENIKDNIVVK